MIKEQKLHKIDKATNWFFNLCILQHLYNDQKLFISTKTKRINFITTARQVIWTKEIRTVLILLSSKRIKVYNIALVIGYNSNLILLRQFYNNSDAMTLIKDRKVIAYVKKERNLFTFKLAQPRKAIAMIGPGCPMHFVS